MLWPLKHSPVPVTETPTWSLYYLAACATPSDPTILWGTDVPTAALDAYVRRANAEGDVLISPAHVLVWAVGRCLAKHPEFNRRVLRRRLYDFQQVNIVIPSQGGKSGVEVCLLCEVDRKSPADIARDIWRQSRELVKGTSRYQQDERVFRLLPGLLRGLLFRHTVWQNNHFHWPAALWGHRMCRAGTMVNYLGHRDAPPMRSFKPSRFPSDTVTVNVTMGPSECSGPDGGPVAPLFVRVDHRVVDAYQLGQFVATLRSYLMAPESLDTVVNKNVMSEAEGNAPEACAPFAKPPEKKRRRWRVGEIASRNGTAAKPLPR